MSRSLKFSTAVELGCAQGEVKNRRKSRSRRGNEAEVFFAPKSASAPGAGSEDRNLYKPY